MARIRPTELKAVMALLDEPHDDVETLARLILSTIEDMRMKRPGYVVVVNADGLLSAWGVYNTIKECQRAVGDPIIASRAGAKGYLMKLTYDLTTQSLDEDEE